jgi:hypothetical protein
MPKVFAVSIAALIVMVGVASVAAFHQPNDREPASVTQSLQMPKDLYHSAKY